MNDAGLATATLASLMLNSDEGIEAALDVLPDEHLARLDALVERVSRRRAATIIIPVRRPQ
jgi:hypothetical protein